MQPKDPTTEVSNVVYLEIQSERADDKATLVKLLAWLYQTFIVELGQKWLITVGDAKIFKVIHSIKEDYGEHFNWVLPFPGDWHTLLNYQKALMKAYADSHIWENLVATEQKLLRP